MGDETIQPKPAAWIEVVLTTCFTLYVAWPFLRTDRYVVGFDTVAYSGPNLSLTQQAWRSGHLATWNDQIFGGVPHLANAQTAVLYPWKLLTLGLGLNRSMGVLVAVHLLLLGVGTVLLVRNALQLRAPAGFVAAVVLVGSGAVMTKSVQFEQIMVFAWAPWLLLAIDAVLRAPKPNSRQPHRAVAGLAFVVAMVLTAGHPQVAYILVPLAAGWLAQRCHHHRATRRLARIAAGGALGITLSLPQLVPLATATSRSALAGGRSLASLADPAYTLAPRSFPQSILGDIFVRDHAFTAGSFEGVSFIGAVALSLVILAVVLAVRARVDRILVATLTLLSGGALVASLGARTFVFRLLYRAVPGFDQARVPARWMLICAVGAAVLAAIAVDAIVQQRVQLSDGAVAFAAAVVGIGAILLVQQHRANAFAVRPRLVVWWIGVGALVCVVATVRTRLAPVLVGVVVVAELGIASAHSFGRKLLRTTPIEQITSPVVSFLHDHPDRSIAITDDRLGEPDYLVAALRPNTNVLHGLRSLDGYDGGIQVTKRWAAMVETLRGGPINPELTLRSQSAVPVNAALLARYGVRWLVLETASRNPADVAPGWAVRAGDGTLVVLENPRFVGAATLRFASVTATSMTAALAQVRNPTIDANLAVIEGTEAGQLVCNSPCLTEPADHVRRSGPGHVTVDINTSQPAVLGIDEQTAPGWHVRIDGRPARAVVVDGFSVGATVPAGRHRVSFTYDEPYLRPAAIVAGAALLVALSMLLPGWPRRRRTGSWG